MNFKSKVYVALGMAIAATAPVSATADSLTTTKHNIYGNPGGLIDMPTAEAAPEGQFSTTVSVYGTGNNQTTRTTLSFQVLPRITASFRYSGIGGLVPRAGRPGFTTLFDRSFDLRLRLLNEGKYVPGVSLGMRDFIGTGIYSGEYLVATKSIGKRLKFSGGIGWGRLGSHGSFASSGTRPNVLLGKGGIPTYDRWFRGDIAAFGGVSYDVNDRLSFSAEYSSDGYDREVRDGALRRKSPWNFGASYKVNDVLRLNAYSLYGNEIGASMTLTINARSPGVIGGGEGAPLPVAVRDPQAARDLGWASSDTQRASVRDQVASLLKVEGIILHGMELTGTRAHVQIRNIRYDMRPQAIGRTARALTRLLPASVETIAITLMVQGLPTSTTTFARSDLERLEHAPATDILAAATIQDGLRYSDDITLANDAFPRFQYNVGPFMSLSVFDPENPVRINVGLRAQAKYHIAPGWVLAGSVSQKLTGNLDKTSIPGASGLPRVRSNIAFYSRTNTPTIDHLTMSYYARPTTNVYSRVTAGYLERMYAGVSGELLWKPVGSPVAFGAELNYVLPRDFDQQFGIRTRATGTGVIPEFNGHLSAYLDVGYGFHTQVDAGRYLAGDWGATLTVDRVFANGWSVGAFATKTDVSSATFGEGSFDKGIRILIPFAWGLGTPTKKKSRTVLRSLTRDGGSRLDVDGRLYDRIQDTHNPTLARTWGKFWR